MTSGNTLGIGEQAECVAASPQVLLRDANGAVPLTYGLRKDQNLDFHFLNGLHEVARFPMLESHYHGPFFRWYARNVVSIPQVMASAQAQPGSPSSPEELARQIRQLCPGDAEPEAATQYVRDFASSSELGPFDGLLGFSEGASIAANILIEQERSSSVRPFKCAILISGLPPLQPGNRDAFLADAMGQIITTPTVHIVGAQDPGWLGGLALFNLCVEGTASLYKHAQGHDIPRVPAITKEMVALIHEMLARVNEHDQMRA